MGYYFNLPPIISIILLIFLPTACLFGAISRCQEGRYVAGILRLLVGWNIIWLLDIIMTLTHGCQVTLLDVIKC